MNVTNNAKMFHISYHYNNVLIMIQDFFVYKKKITIIFYTTSVIYNYLFLYPHTTNKTNNG